MAEHKHRFGQYIEAAPSKVFHALTHARLLHPCRCDVVTVDPPSGKRIYANWSSGFYPTGEYSSVESHAIQRLSKRISMG